MKKMPGNGKEELVLHPDPDAPHDRLAGHVVHEPEPVLDVDSVEGDPEGGEHVEECNLAEDAVEEAELADVAESISDLLGFDVDGHVAAGAAHHHHAEDQN